MKHERIPWSYGAVPAWRTLEQFEALWGLSRAKATLAIEALVREGRMEVRRIEGSATESVEFRIVTG